MHRLIRLIPLAGIAALFLFVGHASAASITGFVLSVSAVEGQAFAAPIATFSDAACAADAPFAVSIAWGDGSSSTAETVGLNGACPVTVSAAHTYTYAGAYALSVTVAPAATPWLHTSLNGTAHVASAPLTGSVGFTKRVNQYAAGAVGTFTTAAPFLPISTFKAVVTWGDGSLPQPVAISSSLYAGTFTVVGGHTYTHSGTYPLTLSISGTDGSAATFTGAATITP